MPYATLQQLNERLGSDLASMLADEDGDAAADVSVLTAALDDASAQIDTALARRYTVPFNPVPGRLVRLTVELAVRHLYLRRREALPPEVDRAYRQAIAQLRDLAEGRTELQGVPPRSAYPGAESTTRFQKRRFDRDQLEPF